MSCLTPYTLRLFMNLKCKMKFYIRIVFSFCIQDPFALRQVNQVTIFVFGYICLFETDKIFEYLLILARNPAGFIKRHVVELHRSVVFMQQPVLNHFKLKFPDTTDDLSITTKLSK